MPEAWIPWYPLRVYPNTQKDWTPRSFPEEVPLMPVSPYLDEMMMTNVRQFQKPRFPNDKRFQTKLCAEVVNSVSKCGLLRKMVMGYGLLVSFAPLPLPYDDHKMEPKRLVSHKTSIYLRAPLKQRTTSSFLCASSQLSCWAWILVGDVWNLVVWVQNLVALQTVW